MEAGICAADEPAQPGKGTQDVALAAEHERLLTSLREQQAAHERHVEELLEKQLKSIAHILSDCVCAPPTWETLGQHRAAPPLSTCSHAKTERPQTGYSDATAGPERERRQSQGSVPSAGSVGRPWDILGRNSSGGALPQMTLAELEEKYDKELESGARRELNTAPTCEGLTRGRLQEVAHDIIRHRYFEYFFQALIVANGIILGIEQDWAVRHLGQASPTYFAIDIVFATCFSVELIMRIISSGRFFLSPWNRDIRWNLLDMVLVLSALVEIGLKLFSDTEVFDVATARLLRLLRLVRIVRVLRVVRWFSDLRIMVLSILGSLKPLGFAIMLLTMIIYIFSICLMQFVLEELERLSGLERGRETSAFKALDAAYGSLARTSYTLFASISGGMNWGEACDPLLGISPVLGLAFMLYLAFSIFCVMNIITGIFVEEAASMTAADDENMLLQELMRRKHFVSEAKRFFEEADKDGSGTLTWPEFKERVQHVRMQKVLENLGIDIVACGARSVFESFDFDGNGTIAIHEFTTGLQQLRGTARSIDLAGLRFEQKRLRMEVLSLLRSYKQLATSQCHGSQQADDAPGPEARASEAPRPEEPVRPKHCSYKSMPL